MSVEDHNPTRAPIPAVSNSSSELPKKFPNRLGSAVSNATEYLLPWCVFLAPILTFSYRFSSSIRLTATAAVLLPVLLKGFLLTQAWPGRRLISLVALSSLSSLYATAFVDITSEKLIIHTLAVSVYVAIVSIRRDLLDLFLWTLLLTMMTLLLGIVGPFVTQYAAKGKFLPVSWVRILPYQVPEILDPNLLANIIGMVLPIVLTFALWGKDLLERKRWRFGCSLLFALLCLALLITESRSGCLAALAAIGLVLGFYYGRATLILLLVVFGVIVLLFLVQSSSPLGSLLSAGSGQHLTTWDGRQEVWNRALSMIRDFPWTGIGAGTYGKVAPLLYPFLLHAPSLQVQHAHNLFLQVAVDFGIPGLVAFVALLAYTLGLGRKAHKEFQATRNHLGCVLVVGYLCGLAAMIIHGIFDAPLWLTKPAPLPFFFMGM